MVKQVPRLSCRGNFKNTGCSTAKNNCNGSMKDYALEGMYVVVGLNRRPMIETVSDFREASIHLFLKSTRATDWKLCEHNGFKVVRVDILFTENNSSLI